MKQELTLYSGNFLLNKKNTISNIVNYLPTTQDLPFLMTLFTEIKWNVFLIVKSTHTLTWKFNKNYTISI